MTLTDETLMAIAQIAVALIGFSGVVVALGRRGKGSWSEAELLQLRTLVEPSVIVLIGAFVPFALSLLDLQGTSVWRFGNGVLLFLHAIGHSLFFVRSAKRENVVVRSQKAVTGIAFLVYAVLIGSVAGLIEYHQLAFLLGLLLGILVSVVNFYLLLFGRQEHAA